MNKEAQEAKAKAEASDMKAKLLAPDTKDTDSNIEAALKTVSGEKVPEGSLSDRLAALRRK